MSAAATPVVAPPGLVGGTLGCPDFRRRRGLRYAYYAGAMYKGIGSRALVVRMGRAGLLGFLGTGGLRPEEIAADLRGIAADLGGQGTYGANFLASPLDPAAERAAAELLVALEVPHVEAAAFTTVTPDLAWLRARGLRAGPDGSRPGTGGQAGRDPEIPGPGPSHTIQAALRRPARRGRAATPWCGHRVV